MLRVLSAVCAWFVAFGLLLPAGVYGGIEEDSFIAGYASAVLEREYRLRPVSFTVKDGVITLSVEEPGGVSRRRIIGELSRIPGVRRVEVVEGGEVTAEAVPAPAAPLPAPEGEEEVRVAVAPKLPVFLPRGELFEPLIASPRWPHMSASYHYYTEDDEAEHVGSANLGASLPLYRNYAPFDGLWQLGLQAGVFSIFDLGSSSADLINADYWVGLAAAYRRDEFSGLLRIFHQSSHLGDEFILSNRVQRENISFEGVDLKLSYDIIEIFRIYAGAGYLFRRDVSELGRWFANYGIEIESPWTFAGGLLRPVAAVDLEHWEENDYDPDVSFRGGVQLENERIGQHKLQLLLEYYNGHSPNGQFYEQMIEFVGLGIHYFF